MKTIRFPFTVITFLVLFSCATSVKFPVSEVTPGARINARIHTDKNENINVDISAKYLASPERLTPSRTTYVVWVETVSNGIINIGQLQSKSSQKSKLEAITPFEPVEIFITAENDGSVKEPQGELISKARF